MGELDGRVTVITGAGRGIGREHALLFAEHGARVVVNDLDVPLQPGVADDAAGSAEEVASEIRSRGGEAVASSDDVATWEGGRAVVHAAVSAFGDLHVVVNNAGFLRDRLVVNMSEAEWDDVIRVHLKAPFVVLHHAAGYWRDEARHGVRVRASVINTTSTSGLYGNPGQTNYGAAKAGIAAMTVIAAQELDRLGIRVNAITPAARTRLTEATPGLDQIVAAPADDRTFDEWDPANVSPLAGWLATEDCPATGQVLYVFGGSIQPMTGWTAEQGVSSPGRWTIGEIGRTLGPLLV
jgi:NAD(P)-dependent dehydrogenase (short-subunit alcohol dehydrogenase family)